MPLPCELRVFNVARHFQCSTRSRGSIKSPSRLNWIFNRLRIIFFRTLEILLFSSVKLFNTRRIERPRFNRWRWVLIAFQVLLLSFSKGFSNFLFQVSYRSMSNKALIPHLSIVQQKRFLEAWVIITNNNCHRHE